MSSEEAEEDVWNVERWVSQLNSLLEQQSSEEEDAQYVETIRTIYRRILTHFPTNAALWYSWMQLEWRRGDYQQLERLFAEALRPHGNVRMWRLYLQYVARSGTTSSGGEGGSSAATTGAADSSMVTRQTIMRAYELALSHVGLDLHSASLYADYISFISQWTTSSLYEEQQKMDQIRRVYHRALGTPLEGIEMLWHQYDAYENALNRVTAKKMLSDKSSAYMAARQAAKELATILGEGGLGDGSGDSGVLPLSASVPSEWALPPPADASIAAAIYGHWLRWIRWERANPLGLVEGSPALNQRIQYAYKVSLGVSLRHYPEMWFDYARWLLLANTVASSAGGTGSGAGQAVKRSALAEEAEATLRTAAQVLPHDLLVNFALADLLESAAATSTSTATTTTAGAAANAVGVEENGATKGSETKSASAGETKVTLPDSSSSSSASPALEVYAALVEALSAQVAANASAPPDQSLVDNLTLALIQQMNCARRVEGIAAARAIFTRARKLPYISYQLFVASAQMELHCKRDATVAGRIYELGMSRFGHCPSYVLTYLEHLLGQQDEANARALFERALVSLAPGEALDLWKTYLDHHFRYGEQATVSLLLERFRAAYGDHPISADLSVFARQYGYEEGGLALATERTWLILSGTGSEAGLRRRLLASMPVPFSVPDRVWELQNQLPLPVSYAGPLLNVDGMVRLLQVVRLVPDAPQAMAPLRRRDQSGATRRSASGGVKKVSSSSSTARRHRDRHRLDGGDYGTSSVTVMEERRNDDLFAQRYGNKQ